MKPVAAARYRGRGAWAAALTAALATFALAGCGYDEAIETMTLGALHDRLDERLDAQFESACLHDAACQAQLRKQREGCIEQSLDIVRNAVKNDEVATEQFRTIVEYQLATVHLCIRGDDGIPVLLNRPDDGPAPPPPRLGRGA